MSNTPSVIRVNINGTDLLRADRERGNANGCAITQCIVRRYPALQRITVTDVEVAVTDPSTATRFTWPTPREAAEWIRQWDSGIDPGPLKFTLPVRDARAKTRHPRTAAQRQHDREYNRARRQREQEVIRNETPRQAEARKMLTASRRQAFRRGIAS